MGLEKINKLKKSMGYTNKKLSEMTGISVSSLDKITAGDNTNPKLETIRLICGALGCSVGDLIDDPASGGLSSEEMNMVKKYRTLDRYGKDLVDSVISKEYERSCDFKNSAAEKYISVRFNDFPVSAGTGDILDDYGSWNTVLVPLTPESRRADFILCVDGDSMEDMFHDGDHVLVHRQETVEQGEIGIFSVNGKGYIKKLGNNSLISLNKKYSEIPLNPDSRCFGKVLGTVVIDDNNE